MFGISQMYLKNTVRNLEWQPTPDQILKQEKQWFLEAYMMCTAWKSGMM